MYSYVKSGTSVSIYAQGVQAGNGTFGSETPSVNMAIGREGAYNADYLNGTIKDARIYDYPLSASEVAALAAAGPNPITQRKPAQIFKTAYMTPIAGRGW